jgi:Fic-DOC domain mobile mystery protein B
MMKKLELMYPAGATPLEPEELEGLIPDYITTRGELNELEHKNIQEAIRWIKGKKSLDVIDPGFVHELHRQMFNQVWKWAGSVRTTGKNIGVDWTQISNQIGQLLGDTRYWIEKRTFAVDEIGARFHHRLVQIHIFPNGNGRHARLMTDLLLEDLEHKSFTWGAAKSGGPLETEGKRRDEYIAALKLADENDYEPLKAFVRS